MSDKMQELRDYLAREVMGWAKDDYSKRRMNPEPAWLLGDGEEILCKHWQPDENANQALGLLEQVNMNYTLVDRHLKLHWWVTFRGPDGMPYSVVSQKADTLPLAICRAVKAWREAQDV